MTGPIRIEDQTLSVGTNDSSARSKLRSEEFGWDQTCSSEVCFCFRPTQLRWPGRVLTRCRSIDPSAGGGLSCCSAS